MAKARTDQRGRRHIAHEDVLAEALKNTETREAYMERRYIHEIARAVRSMREAAGMSQADLAKMLGMKQPAIARLETSQTNAPNWKTLDRVAFALGKQLTLNLGVVAKGKPIVMVRQGQKEAER